MFNNIFFVFVSFLFYLASLWTCTLSFLSTWSTSFCWFIAFGPYTRMYWWLIQLLSSSWRRLQPTLCSSHFAGSIQFNLVMNWIWIHSLKYSKAQQPQQHWAKDNIFCKPSTFSLAMLPTLRLPPDALYLYFPNTPFIHIYCHINLENRIRIIIYNQ